SAEPPRSSATSSPGRCSDPERTRRRAHGIHTTSTAATRRPRGGDMIDFIQQLIGGVALGCVYGLIALGFVLIYKATEVVNFGQGEIMMLGAFLSYTFIVMLGLDYWIGFLLCVIAMAIIGSLMERVVIRPILGYPQFSVVMATIGLGLVLR